MANVPGNQRNEFEQKTVRKKKQKMIPYYAKERENESRASYAEHKTQNGSIHGSRNNFRCE